VSAAGLVVEKYEWKKFLLDCAKPDHDPSDCTNEGCDICRQFYKDQAADRQYDDKLEKLGRRKWTRNFGK